MSTAVAVSAEAVSAEPPRRSPDGCQRGFDCDCSPIGSGVWESSTDSTRTWTSPPSMSVTVTSNGPILRVCPMTRSNSSCNSSSGTVVSARGHVAGVRMSWSGRIRTARVDRAGKLVECHPNAQEQLSDRFQAHRRRVPCPSHNGRPTRRPGCGNLQGRSDRCRVVRSSSSFIHTGTRRHRSCRR